jgi:hypothetical protein
MGMQPRASCEGPQGTDASQPLQLVRALSAALGASQRRAQPQRSVYGSSSSPRLSRREPVVRERHPRCSGWVRQTTARGFEVVGAELEVVAAKVEAGRGRVGVWTRHFLASSPQRTAVELATAARPQPGLPSAVEEAKRRTARDIRLRASSRA